MDKNKLHIILDYDKLTEDLKEQVKLVYPEGYSQHLIQFKNKEGNTVSALPFETDVKIYMIRMSVSKAEARIANDTDYDEDGFLKEDIREKYEESHKDVDYLSENDNYDDN